MNVKKVLPVALFVVLAIITLGIKRCNSNKSVATNTTRQRTTTSRYNPNTTSANSNNGTVDFDRTTNDLFFTQHAKCRMKCRHITQAEVKDILVNGNVNYNKSNLNDPRGPTYALEGMTSDRQHVRIIFAPKQQHLTVVTVIDLEEDFACNCGTSE